MFEISLSAKIVLGISLILLAIYKWATKSSDFFEKNNVDHVKPIPFLGNMMSFVMKKKDFSTLIKEYSQKFSDKQLFGFFQLTTPIYVLNHPEIIKQVCVKDFNHFVDHIPFLDPDVDPMFSKNLFSLLGDKWKTMRTTLSPAFTGSKMRMMFELVSECANDSINYLSSEAERKDKLEIEMKDFFSRYTNDVIASAAFGIKVDSLANRENEFFETGKKSTKFDGINALIFILYNNIPKIMKFFKVTILDKKLVQYFHTLVIDAMRYREKNNIVRPDMINLLIQMKKGILRNEEDSNSDPGKNLKAMKFVDEDFTAQCFIFFLAGFDTSSTLLTFMAHELMVNKDVQERLIAEVDQTRAELNGGSLTYEAINSMKYMDMVTSETLRKWPPTIITDRICVKPYVLDDGEKKVQINIGDSIWLSVMGIHHNPEYYPEPEKFNPERFSDENKGSIDPATYLPFGFGPRICIGSRFALMECKAIFYHLLSRFTIEISEKTQHPLATSKLDVTLNTEKGAWVHLKPRITT